MKNKAIVNHANESGDTALHVASNLMNSEIILVLLQFGADAKLQNANNKTAQQLLLTKAKNANKLKDCEEALKALA